MNDDYEKMAKDFIDKTETTFRCKFIRHGKHFANDDTERDIYAITLTRSNREYTFKFGQSINCSGIYWKYGKYYAGVSHRKIMLGDWEKNKDFSAPTEYDVLASITKNDPGSFNDFCSDFGYNNDSMIAHKTYEAVLDEFTNIQRLYTDDEIETMNEIN